MFLCCRPVSGVLCTNFFFFAYIKRQFVLWWYLLFRINRFCLFGCPRDIYIKKYNPSGWKQLHVFLVWSRYFLGFAASWCTCLWTADSIIRSDGKSLCKVLCIITYQNQDTHPQILWVTNSQQLRDFVSTQKKKEKKRRKKKKTEEEEWDKEHFQSRATLSIYFWLYSKTEKKQL